MATELKENAIEWITGEDTVTLTLTQRRFISRIYRMAEKHAECVKILAENPDGSIMATIPLSAIHLTIYDTKRAGFGKGEEEE